VLSKDTDYDYQCLHIEVTSWQTTLLLLLLPLLLLSVFKPLPPIGAGGGYMFSGRPSVPLSMRP